MSEDLQEKHERRGKVPVVIGISLALIAAVLVSISVDTYWLHDRIFDTENFVESLAPLPKDPVISTAVAVQAAESLDVGATAEQRIGDAPPGAARISHAEIRRAHAGDRLRQDEATRRI